MTDTARAGPGRLFEHAAQLERAGEWHNADRVYQDMYRAAIHASDAQAIATSARRRAQIQLQHGAAEEAEELADLSREIAERCNLKSDLARAWNVVGMVQFQINNHTAAESAYEQAIQQAREAGEDRTIIHASRNLGVVLENRGDSAGAKSLYLESVAATLREDDPRAAASIYAHLGSTAQALNEWMEAELHYRRAIELAERSGDVYVATMATVSLAGPLIATHELAAAGEVLNTVELKATANENPRATADTKRMRAKISVAQDDLAGAGSHLLEALNIATIHKLSREKAEVLEDIGNLRQLQSRPILAKSAWREALELFRELGAEANVARLTQLIQA